MSKKNYKLDVRLTSLAKLVKNTAIASTLSPIVMMGDM